MLDNHRKNAAPSPFTNTRVTVTRFITMLIYISSFNNCKIIYKITCTNWNNSVPLRFDFFCHLQVYSSLNLTPLISMKGMLALCRRSESHPKFCTMFRAYCEIAAVRIAKQTNTSKNELFLRRNACLGYFDISQMFFYAVRTRIQGYELLPSRPAQRKIAFTSTVGCK